MGKRQTPVRIDNDLYNYILKKRTDLKMNSINKTIRRITKEWIQLKKEKQELTQANVNNTHTSDYGPKVE